VQEEICAMTASSETYSEKLRREKGREKGRHCELSKDLFLYMPLPISKIIEEINRRIKKTGILRKYL
jgi:hypothetical protein